MSDGPGRAWPSSGKGIFKRPDSAPNHYNTDLTQKAEGGSASTKRKKLGGILLPGQVSRLIRVREKRRDEIIFIIHREAIHIWSSPVRGELAAQPEAAVRLRLNYRPNAFYIANSIVIDRPLWWLLPLEFLGELRETVGG